MRRGHSIKGERIYKVEYSNKPADCYCYAIYAPRVGMYGGRWNPSPPLPRLTLLQISYKFNMINLKSTIGDLITRKTNSYIPRLKYTHPLPPHLVCQIRKKLQTCTSALPAWFCCGSVSDVLRNCKSIS